MRTYKRTIRAEHIGGLNIAVTFEDGTSGVFDFTPFADYPCYRPLKSEGLFSMVKAAHGTLTWPGDIDIAPEAVWVSSVGGMSEEGRGKSEEGRGKSEEGRGMR